MVVKIRLARLSKRHSPFYNIVVAQARSARDSKPMEVLGTFNPVPQTPLTSAHTPEKVQNPSTGEMEDYKPRKYKDIKLDITRTKYWLGVGAQPSEGVQGILGLLGLWEGRPGLREGEGMSGRGAKVGAKETQAQKAA